MRNEATLKTDFAYIVKMVFYEQYDRERHRSLARALLAKLCRFYGSNAVVAKKLGGVLPNTLGCWSTRDGDVPIDGVLAIAKLYIQTANICNLRHCEAIYRVFRALVKTEPNTALALFDEYMAFKLVKFSQHGVPVQKAQLMAQLKPNDFAEDFMLSQHCLQDEVKLPLLVNSNHELLQSPVLLKAVKERGGEVVYVHSIDIDACLTGQQRFPDFVCYSISTRCRVAEIFKKHIKMTKVMSKNKPNYILEVKVVNYLADIVAKQVGFKGHNAFNLAKQVLRNGIAELIDAMEKEKLSISMAAKIAKLPKAQQWQQLQTVIMTNHTKMVTTTV